MADAGNLPIDEGASGVHVARPSGLAPDRGLPMSLHRQITDALRARISGGVWPAHYRLPSEPDLAGLLKVSRGTLRSAIGTLVREGLLVQIRGRGTFVAAPVGEPAIAQRFTTLSEDFGAHGLDWRTETLDAGVVAPPGMVAALLSLPAGGRTFRLTRRGLSSGRAAAYLVNHVRLDLAPDIETIDFASHSLFSVLENEFGLAIRDGRRTFAAVAAPTTVASALGLAPGAPVQYLEQVTYLADGTPVEYSDVWIDSAQLRVTSVLERNHRPTPRTPRTPRGDG